MNNETIADNPIVGGLLSALRAPELPQIGTTWTSPKDSIGRSYTGIVVRTGVNRDPVMNFVTGAWVHLDTVDGQKKFVGIEL